MQRSIALAIEIAGEIQSKFLEIRCYKSGAVLFKKSGDFLKALEFHEKFQAVQEEVLRQEAEQKTRNVHLMYEIENTRKQAALYHEKNIRLEHEVEEKNKELRALAIKLVQKNKTLGLLEKQSPDFLKEGPINVSADLDKHFDEAHPDFLKKLTKDYPGLTPMEMKICTLLKIGLSTKEIADILFTSTRTVDTHRFRIRKKLQLSEYDNLSSFLALL